MAARALLAGMVAGAPYLLLYLTAWDEPRHFTGDWPFPIALVGAPLLGSLVFTLITVGQAGRRPWIASGIAFRLGMTLAMAGAWGSQARDEGRRYEHFSFGWAIGAGVLILFLALVGVMIGVALARLLRRRDARGICSRIEPWQLGTTIAAVELISVGVLAAVYA
jgi:hypothetical protein